MTDFGNEQIDDLSESKNKEYLLGKLQIIS